MKQITTSEIKKMVKEELQRQLVKESGDFSFDKFWPMFISDIHIKTAKIGNWFTRIPEKLMFEPEVHMNDVETILDDKRYKLLSPKLKDEIISLTRKIWYDAFPKFVKDKYKMSLLDVFNKSFEGKLSATKIWQTYLESKKSVYERLFGLYESKRSLKEASFKPGDKVKVSQGSGLDSGKVGVVVSPQLIKTDGRGIPTNIQGAYKPVDWKKEVPIKFSDGTLTTMFKNRLTIESKQPLKEGKFDANRLLKLIKTNKTPPGSAELFANGKHYGFDEEGIEAPYTVWGQDEDGGDHEIKIKDIEFVTINGKRIS